MGFRNDLEAAHQRVDALERDLARARADAATSAELRRALEKAQSELAALRGEPSPFVARANAVVVRLAGMTFLVALGATATAGYFSEGAGVAMSYLAAAALGGWLAALTLRRRAGRVFALGTTAGAVAALGALVVFYAAIWPAL